MPIIFKRLTIGLLAVALLTLPVLAWGANHQADPADTTVRDAIIQGAATAIAGPIGGGIAAQVITGAAGGSQGVIGSQILSVIGKSVAYTVFGINYLIGYIGGIFFALAGIFLQLGLELNARIIVSPIVQTGWLITRDLANLGFVIAIIALSFVVMLRLQYLPFSQTLTRLIIVALLVNFSLTLTGILVDASGVLSNFFVQKIAPRGFGEINQFAENLAAAFQIQKLHEVKDATQLPNLEGVVDSLPKMAGLIASIFFVAAFTIIGAITMWALAALVLVRYVAITILLILMPLAWVAYIFPKLEEHYKKWWSAFLQWLLFLPTALFFVHLAILTVINFKDNPNSPLKVAAAIDANSNWLDSFLLVIANTFQSFAQMLVVVLLMGGGLIAAQKFSLSGAGFILKGSETAKKWATGKITGAALKTAALPVGAGLGAMGLAGRKILTSKLAKGTASTLSQVPLLRRAGTGLSNAIAATKEAGSKQVKDYQEKYLTNLPTASDVRGFTRSFVVPEALTPIARAAEMNELIKRRKFNEELDKLTKEERVTTMSNWINAAKETGLEKELLKVRPDFAPELGKNLREEISKLSAKAIIEVSDEALAKSEVAAAMILNQIKAIAKQGTPKMKDAVEKAVNQAFENFSQTAQFSAGQKSQLENLLKRGAKLQLAEIKNFLGKTSVKKEDLDSFANTITNKSFIGDSPAWK